MRSTMASPASIIVASALHWIILTHTACQASPSWQISQCDKDRFIRNLGRVCAVYKRSVAEFLLVPLLSPEGGYILQRFKRDSGVFRTFTPYQDPVGFDFRTPLNGDGTTPTVSNVQPGFVNFFNAPVNFGIQPDQGPAVPIYPATGDPSSPMFSFASPFTANFYYNFGVGGPMIEPGFDPTSTFLQTDDPDLFRRWRRQAIVNALIMKCCTPSSCIPLDLIRVAKEHNICDK